MVQPPSDQLSPVIQEDNAIQVVISVPDSVMRLMCIVCKSVLIVMTNLVVADASRNLGHVAESKEKAVFVILAAEVTFARNRRNM